MNYKYAFLPIGSISYKGIIPSLMTFVNKEQLLNEKLWSKFVKVFKYHEDNDDLAWRCEYWGKMMRGACLCYQYQNNQQLYKVLEKTVKDILNTQGSLGRISSYTVKNEFQGWDMWGRKYVITGLLHFLEITKDQKLKTKIIKALKKHTDYIIKHIGKNKINITKTSNIWLGVNSASILEPIVSLYKLTHEKRYLEFAKYIVSTGGVNKGNLIKDANNDKLLPYQYVENKAYETMSFFEGVLELAIVTKNHRLLKTAINFFDKVTRSEISIIGNAGSEGEKFSHAAINQTKKPREFMQETCVVTTYMRVMAKLNLLTGEEKYYERFSTAALNCFLGSINTNHNPAKDYFKKKTLNHYLPFDSYSPLVNDYRGLSTGGLQYFKDGSFYGCCASIGSASIGLMALTYIIQNKHEIIFNDYYDNAAISTKDFKANIESNYIQNGKVKIKVKKNSKQLLFRIPSWSKHPSAIIDKKLIKVKPGTYLSVNKSVHNITFDFKPSIQTHHLNHMSAFNYGQFTLGIDEESNPKLKLEQLTANKLILNKIKPTKSSLLSFTSNNELIFKDYSSLGKNYNKRLTVWIKDN
ncbi:MAG: glycoside hydrolase family 127 protein [Bacilli bacterium]|nr:glycoside hydrolase family 127 protein [Bacilli bacterium]